MTLISNRDSPRRHWVTLGTNPTPHNRVTTRRKEGNYSGVSGSVVHYISSCETDTRRTVRDPFVNYITSLIGRNGPSVGTDDTSVPYKID